MTSQPLGLSEEELRRQDRWLRELVRGLVGEDDVEDVVQETWASALRRQGSVGRPRAWLQVVAKNFARRTLRTKVRRADREQAAARGESQPSAEEALELLDLQQRVVQAVRELHEPYREAVLLRYTLDLSISEIARRSDAQQPAVRQRLKRGLDLVRERLEADHGPQWMCLPALAL